MINKKQFNIEISSTQDKEFISAETLDNNTLIKDLKNGFHLYSNGEGYCDYYLIHIIEDNIIINPLWTFKEVIKFNEISNGRIQYTMINQKNISNMNISKMFEYMLDRYDEYMDLNNQCHDESFEVIDSNKLPHEIKIDDFKERLKI